MTDLISRQAALDAIDKNRDALLSSGMTGAEHILVHYGRRVIEKLPTAEQRRGKWEDVEEVLDEGITDGTPYTIMSVGYKCSECGTEMGNLWSFCPNCGAKMDDDWEEPEINPCRGCDDYDGRGGCKSHGGCGAERSEDGET